MPAPADRAQRRLGRRARPIALLTSAAVALAAFGAVTGSAPALASSAPARGQNPPPHKHRHKPPPPPEVTLPASLTGPAAPVTMLPVGLSLEYPLMAHDLGGGACPPQSLVAKLLQLGSPPIALAGFSQDMTAPNGALTSTPGSWEAATLYELPAAFWSQLHCLLAATGEPLTAGIDLRTGQPSWAEQIVAGAQSAATAGLAFSLGNEPDLYRYPNYAALDQPLAGEEALESNLYLRLAGSMRQALGGGAVTGPEVSRPASWQHVFGHVIEALQPQTVGVHVYPLTVCRTPRTATIHGLLSTRSGDAPARLGWVVADATAAHLPAILSEANSVSCGGRAGVSDSAAAAVWSVRFVLSALKTGFRQVFFHFSGGPYDPFLVNGETVVDRPIDSALVALNRWLPVGASLQSVPVGSGLVGTRVGEPGGGTLLLLDNEESHDREVLVRGQGDVRVEALAAARAGVQVASVRAQGGRMRMRVDAQSVMVVSGCWRGCAQERKLVTLGPGATRGNGATHVAGRAGQR
jgi:hypothetical protein